ncbi:MAG: hypothetical protein II891_00185 [Bacteroidales bacterium]|nr:hypothetical protein [Bacteroidales bacterium]
MKKIWFFMMLILACACSVKPAPDDKSDQQEEAAPDLSGFTRVPLKSSVSKVQPMTGIVTWRDSKYDTDNVQLEFAYMLYNEVCKKKTSMTGLRWKDFWTRWQSST